MLKVFCNPSINILYITLLIFVFISFSQIRANTLDDVKNRGYLNCGVAESFIGFASPDDSGEWIGFDVDLCRAVAVAIFGDSKKVNFIPTSNRSRFPALALKEIDLLARNTTWSYSRDTNLEFEFVGINFYDGQAFLVPKSLDILALDRGSIVVDENLASYLVNTISPDKSGIRDLESAIRNIFRKLYFLHTMGNKVGDLPFAPSFKLKREMYF